MFTPINSVSSNFSQVSFAFLGASGGPQLGMLLLGALIPWANWKVTFPVLYYGTSFKRLVSSDLQTWVGLSNRGLLYKKKKKKTLLTKSLSFCVLFLGCNIWLSSWTRNDQLGDSRSISQQVVHPTAAFSSVRRLWPGVKPVQYSNASDCVQCNIQPVAAVSVSVLWIWFVVVFTE